MTPATTERVANVIIGAAVIGAAVVVLRTPSLRRLAWQLAKTTLAGTAPGWLGREVQQAWAQSARPIP
jgi:hypothetical protein